MLWPSQDNGSGCANILNYCMYTMKKNVVLFFASLVIVVTISSEVFGQKRAYRTPEFAYNWGKPSLHPDHIILNVTEDPSTSMSVTWRTSVEVQVGYAEIAKATPAPKFWRNATTLKAKTETLDATEVQYAQSVTNYHSATFTGLEPNTIYAYRVGNGSIWSEWIQFRTAPTEGQPFSFLYVGDAQNYVLELWSRLIRAGFQKAPQAGFVVHAGDLINNGHSDREWHEWHMAGSFIHGMLPSMATPGNHEYYPINDEGWKTRSRQLSVQWQPGFTLPDNGPEGFEETVYYMDYGDARIISLNSNTKIGKQVPWLDSILTVNPKKWTIITFHHPLYSASSGRNNLNLRNGWKAILDKHQVDLVIQGHDHAYARGHTMPTDSNLVAGLNTRDQYIGTAYVVSVSGGKMYPMRPDGWADFPGAVRDRGGENTQLFQVITVDGDVLMYESYTPTGDLYDAFDLVKSNDGMPNTFVDRQQEAIPVRTHEETISYYDTLPENIEKKLEKNNPGYTVIRVTYYDEPEFRGYVVRMQGEEDRIELTLDEKGNVVKE